MSVLAHNVKAQHRAAKRSLHRPRVAAIPFQLPKHDATDEYVMSPGEQRTHDRALEQFGQEAAAAWKQLCRDAKRQRDGIESETLALQTIEKVRGQDVYRTVASLTHDQYERLQSEWEESHFDPQEMPWATIGGVQYELPYVERTDRIVVVEPRKNA
jgi:hypothetical protein